MNVPDKPPNPADDKLKKNEGIGLAAFLTALGVSLVIFGIQSGLFLMLRNKLARIL